MALHDPWLLVGCACAVALGVLIAVRIHGPTAQDVLAWALAAAFATAGLGAAVVALDRRRMTPPDRLAPAPVVPDMQAPGCGPREEQGALVAPLDERTHEALLAAERARFGGG